jgi:hypothetical protein
VIVWDRGWYENLSDTSVERAIRNGALTFFLHGEKLRGGFALRRLNDRNWILVKMKDVYADRRTDIAKTRPESVVSRRTIEQVGAAAR